MAETSPQWAVAVAVDDDVNAQAEQHEVAIAAVSGVQRESLTAPAK